MSDWNLRTVLPKPWALVVRFLIIVPILTITTIAWQMLAPKPQFIKYAQLFELNFEGLSAQQFPDGTPFLLSDVVSRPILAEVHQVLGLEHRHQLNLDEFQAAVQVVPYSPDYHRLIRNARARAATKQSAGELARLRHHLINELSTAESGAMQLSLVLPAGKALPTADAFEALNAIAQTWANRAVVERGVLGLETPIYTAKMFDAARFDRLDYLVAVELLIENIQLVRNNIELLNAVPNASGIRDPETGFTLEGIAKAIDDVAQLDLRMLVDPIRQLGITRDPESMKLLYERRISELRLNRDHLLRRARVTQDIMNIQLATDDGVIQSWSQLGDAFIDRLIDLAAQSEEEASRQQLAQQVLEYRQEVVALAQEEAELLFILAQINSGNEVTFEQTVANELHRILIILTEYTEVVERIHTQLGLQTTGGIEQLLRSFENTQVVIQSESLPRHEWIRTIAFIIFSSIISLFVLIAYEAWRFGLGRSKPNK